MPDHPAAKLCRPGTVPAGPVPGAPCGWIRCSRDQCQTARPDQHREGPAPPRSAAETKKPERTANAARPGFSSAHGPPQSAPPPRSAPGRTAPPTVTTCPICPAWAVSACPMSSGPPARSPARAAPSSRTPPPCCPHPCQTYRQRQPQARQHPAASPTPEGSDSPPNGIEL